MAKIFLMAAFLLILNACGRHSPSYSGTLGHLHASQNNNNLRLKACEVHMDLVAKNVDSMPAFCAHIAKRYDGYVLSETIQDVYWSDIKIRVPASRFSEAVSELSDLGKIISKRIDCEDLTEDHTNLQIHLEGSKRAKKRFLELLDTAYSVENIIKIEKELQRLNIEIDTYEIQIAHLKLRLEYTPITIRFRKKQKPGPLGYLFVGLYKGVTWLFIRDY